MLDRGMVEVNERGCKKNVPISFIVMRQMGLDIFGKKKKKNLLPKVLEESLDVILPRITVASL